MAFDTATDITITIADLAGAATAVSSDVDNTGGSARPSGKVAVTVAGRSDGHTGRVGVWYVESDGKGTPKWETPAAGKQPLGVLALDGTNDVTGVWTVHDLSDTFRVHIHNASQLPLGAGSASWRGMS